MAETLTSATSPQFQFVYNPLDLDSFHARHRLLVEPELTRLFVNETRACCAAAGGGLVVDVGAHFGWYSLLALSLGCRVVAFEPVAAYREAMRLALHLNGPSFARRLQLYRQAVYDEPGEHGASFRMLVPQAGSIRPKRLRRPSKRDPKQVTLGTHRRTLLGMAALLGPRGQGAIKNVSQLHPGTLTYTEPVQVVRVDDVVLPMPATPAPDSTSGGSSSGGTTTATTSNTNTAAANAATAPVCMLKVDVEGLEAQALRSASSLLGARGAGAHGRVVRAVQIEVSRKDTQVCENLRMLRDLLLRGFELYPVSHGEMCWSDGCLLQPGRSSPRRKRSSSSSSSRTSSQISIEIAKLPPNGTLWREMAVQTALRFYKETSHARLFSWNLFARRETSFDDNESQDGTAMAGTRTGGKEIPQPQVEAPCPRTARENLALLSCEHCL